MRSLILAASCLLFASCATTEKVYVDSYSAELICQASTDHYFDNGTLSKCRLTEPAMLGGIVCDGWIHFNEDGCIDQCLLARPIPFSGLSVPVGSWLLFDTEDPDHIAVIMFPQDMVVEGVTVRGGVKIMTSFHQNGRLKGCFLREDQVIDGIPCKASVFQEVRFHENGQLESCELSEDATLGDMTLPTGDRIELDSSGQLILLPL